MKPKYHGFKTLNTDPFIGVQDDFLTLEECQYIVTVSQSNIKRALVENFQTSSERTGAYHWLHYSENPRIQAIRDRLAAIVGMPASHAEAMQVIHYGTSEKYNPHFDAFDITTDAGISCCQNGGQRLVTCLIYLNTVTEGGGTSFPRLNIEVQPKPGRIIIFNNVDIRNQKDIKQNSLHGGDSVIAGEKWACNIWFRESPIT